MYKRVSFILDHPANLSVEFNEERFHKLHLFAGKIEEKPDKHENNVLVIKGSSNRGESVGDNLNQAIKNMPEGRMVYIVDGGFLRTSDDCIAIYGSRFAGFL